MFVLAILSPWNPKTPFYLKKLHHYQLCRRRRLPVALQLLPRPCAVVLLLLQKMTALKKAYAEIILNTAKEAAARIIVSERRAQSFQRDLLATKDEALRIMLRIKQMIDLKLLLILILRDLCLLMLSLQGQVDQYSQEHQICQWGVMSIQLSHLMDMEEIKFLMLIGVCLLMTIDIAHVPFAERELMLIKIAVNSTARRDVLDSIFRANAVEL